MEYNTIGATCQQMDKEVGRYVSQYCVRTVVLEVDVIVPRVVRDKVCWLLSSAAKRRTAQRIKHLFNLLAPGPWLLFGPLLT